MKQKREDVWRNRIVDYGEVDPEQLLANPKNWRIHPRFQQQVLEAVLNTVGWVAPIIVNKLTDFVVDGHLRVQLALKTNQPKIPVAYVELSEAEEDEILATFDPITGLAVADKDMLEDAIRRVHDPSEYVGELMTRLAEQEGIVDKIASDADTDEVSLDLQYRIIVECVDESEQSDLLSRFEEEGLTCRALIS